jgi:hypothetical protein
MKDFAGLEPAGYLQSQDTIYYCFTMLLKT